MILEARKQLRIMSKVRVILKVVGSKVKTLKTFSVHSLDRVVDLDREVDFNKEVGLVEAHNLNLNSEVVNKAKINSQERSLHPTYLETQMLLY